MYNPSKNRVKSLVKPQTAPLVQVVAHGATNTGFVSTFKLDITHIYGPAPKVVIDDTIHRNGGVVTYERTIDKVAISFTELVTGVVEFDDVDMIITVKLQQHKIDIAHQ